MKLVNARQMQEIDRLTIDGGHVPSLTLMENAGRAAAEAALEMLRPRPEPQVDVFCGKGNNGGDGLVVARLLAAAGVRVRVHMTHSEGEISPDARANWKRLPADVHVAVLPAEIADPGPDASEPAFDTHDALRSNLQATDLCIDALLGTGVERDLRGRLAALINTINAFARPTLAVDAPSGVDCSSGEIRGTAIRATRTVTFGLPKRGLVFHPGRARVGQLTVADIGFPDRIVDAVPDEWRLFAAIEARRLLPVLQPTAHKYSRGCVLVIAGSRSYPGAAALSADAAMRSGAGIVHLVAPASIRDVLEAQLTEVIVHAAPETATGTCAKATMRLIEPLLQRAGAVAVGPGLGQDDETIDWVRGFLGSTVHPVIVDADALLSWPKGPPAGPRIVTPHLGELGRWVGSSLREEERVEAARRAAQERQVVVVSKGAPTVVALPDGVRSVNASGNVGLATAGSGDVLTGIIGSFAAQGVRAADAACVGVFVHGAAADRLGRRQSLRSVRARDIAAAIGPALLEVEQTHGPPNAAA